MLVRNKLLYLIWACLYILCVGLGTIQETVGVVKLALTVISVIFFVPGVMLLYFAATEKDHKGVYRVRWVCICSLALTAAALAGFLASGASNSLETVNLVFDILQVVSAPTICSQYWFLSLFLWGCLLTATFMVQKKKK